MIFLFFLINIMGCNICKYTINEPLILEKQLVVSSPLLDNNSNKTNNMDIQYGDTQKISTIKSHTAITFLLTPNK